eukprot:gene31446-6627_t
MGVGEDSSLVCFEEDGHKREGAGVHGMQHCEGEPVSETMGIHHLQSHPPINPSPSLASTSVVIVGQERSMEIDCSERRLPMISLENMELVVGPVLLPDNVPVTPPAAGNVPVAPQPVGNVPVAPQPVGNVPVAPQPVGNVPVAPQPVGNVPVAPQPVGNVQVAPQPVDNVPGDPQLGLAEMNSLERRRLQRSTQ